VETVRTGCEELALYRLHGFESLTFDSLSAEYNCELEINSPDHWLGLSEPSRYDCAVCLRMFHNSGVWGQKRGS
jgi:hypothetical protein